MRRSFLTSAAMVIGLALLVFSLALAEGSHEDWIKGGSRMGSGHITIQAPDFLRTKKIRHHLDASQTAAVSELLTNPTLDSLVEIATPRLTILGLANSPANALPVVVLGIDPEREPYFSELNEKLIEGRYLEDGDRLHAYIGKTLAERLRLDIGSRFVLTAQDASGEMAGQMVRVAGIFRMGLPAADQGIVHIPLSTAQSWLGLENAVTSFDILLETTRSQEQAMATLKELEQSDGVAVIGWQESQPELNSAVEMDNFGNYIFHGILFAIITLAIVNTILMSVLQRVREFGVLRALGLRRREAGTMVFFEGMLLTTFSGLVGMLVGIGVTWGFFRNGLDFSAFMDGDFSAAGTIIDPVIIPQFAASQLLLALASIAAIGMLSSIYPAYMATKIDVAESMKFET
jgi:ABC-type lipoprotein release transport system permease subunit